MCDIGHGNDFLEGSKSENRQIENYIKILNVCASKVAIKTVKRQHLNMEKIITNHVSH